MWEKKYWQILRSICWLENCLLKCSNSWSWIAQFTTTYVFDSSIKLIFSTQHLTVISSNFQGSLVFNFILLCWFWIVFSKYPACCKPLVSLWSPAVWTWSLCIPWCFCTFLTCKFYTWDFHTKVCTSEIWIAGQCFVTLVLKLFFGYTTSLRHCTVFL